MALQSLDTDLLLFPTHQFDDGAGTQTLDADGEYVAAVHVNPSARTVRGLTSYFTGVTASGTLRWTIETVGANGLPTGTLAVAGATVDVNVTAIGLVKADFGADVTMPAGHVAFVVKRVSGTFNGALRTHGSREMTVRPPYPVLTIGIFDGTPLCAVPFVGVPPDETYLRLTRCQPPQIAGAASGIGANSEIGAMVSIAFKCRAYGIAFYGLQGSAPSQSPEARLYSSDGDTLLASGAFSNRMNGATTRHIVPFDTPAELSPGDYYMILHGFDGANALTLSSPQIGDSAMAGTMGLASARLNRTGSSGAFTEAAYIPLLALVLDRLDDGVQAATPHAQTVLGVL